MSHFADDDLTRDAFLGGRIHLWQPKQGYRAGVDPILLAASVPAKAGDTILELGCGAGAAILSLDARVSGLQLVGVELQPAYAKLAERNAAENHSDMTVICGDLGQLPHEVRQQQFDHVIANPPYFRPGAHSQAQDEGRKLALGEQTPLSIWVETAARRLKPKGYFHLIQRVDRLPDVLAACQGRLGSVVVLPLAGRAGRAPELFILRARKEGRAAFRLLQPLILHVGESHHDDSESYSLPVSAALRHGAPLDW